MKKLLTLLLFVPLLFAGCSDDDDARSTNPTDIVGKWEYLSMEVDVSMSNNKFREDIVKWMLNDRDVIGDLEFTVDGKFGHYDVIERKWYWATYTLEKGELEACFDDEEYGIECFTADYSLKGNTLKIKSDVLFDIDYIFPDAGIKKAIQILEYRRY